MPKTVYTGKFKQVLQDGKTVVDVQVEDSTGNGSILDLKEYIRRGVQPPIENLPTQHEYKR